MTKLIQLLFDTNIFNYLIIIATFIVVYLIIIAGIRVIIEIITNGVKECITHNFIAKHSQELLRNKLNTTDTSK